MAHYEYIKDINGNAGRTFSTADDLYTFCGFSLFGVSTLIAADILEYPYDDDEIEELEKACTICNDILRAVEKGNAPMYHFEVARRE